MIMHTIASAPATGAFAHHLREAIALNRERAPRYAALTRGRSRRISRALIASELALLPIARWFDARAEPYERAGIPLVSSLFVPMAGAAAFAPYQPVPASKVMQAPVVSRIRAHARAAFARGGFPAAAAVLHVEVVRLESSPGTECMIRHLLESARRIAALAPVHAAAARHEDLPDPTSLLHGLLRMHLWGLGAGAMLDAWARPLQVAGVPILAQDLPPIPLPDGAMSSGSTPTEMHAG